MSITYPSNESEALLHFKAAFNDSTGLLSSWVNGTDCRIMWDGVVCNNQTKYVISLIVYGLYQGVISESLCQLHFLTSLKIFGVRATLPSCLGNLTYIQILDLSVNELSGMIPSSICFLTHLAYLDLGFNEFNGSIPSCLGNLSSLYYLDLSNNQLSGNIPISLGSLTLLRHLYLGGNPLSKSIPDSMGNLSLLESLSIGDTQLSGITPPSYTQLSSLASLDVSGNRFNETVASSSLPPSLVDLRLSLNHNQSVSETFFHNLTSLELLYLSDCMLNFSSTWIPSFQLREISLVSCMIDDAFPPWISTQFSLHKLELVNTGLVGEIPSWLLETNPQLLVLNLSRNHLEGTIF
ncbi:receptor-like protein 35 [Cryptomeria japonica]|uniref:receptor-like protein 35 n=1 Tax=Cryptomeria japonica TaxID=3369 RepID=UPI0027DAB4AF|nr:receptor-like protein 35 [Cryptomeria japonica]